MDRKIIVENLVLDADAMSVEVDGEEQMHTPGTRYTDNEKINLGGRFMRIEPELNWYIGFPMKQPKG